MLALLRVPARILTLLTVLAIPLLLPATAGAHGPADCTAGPARTAGGNAPHAWDSHGTEPALGVGTVGNALYGGAGDVIGGWITGPSAWADRSAPQTYNAVIRLESLQLSTAAGPRDHAPALARYYIAFQGEGGERWLRAVFESPGTWSWAYGTLNGTTFTSNGNTTGTVDAANGTLTIAIPAALLPARPANGAALSTDITLVRSYVRYPNGVNTGALVLVDEASSMCPVTLYEAAPAA